METFTPPKAFEPNPQFKKQRQKNLRHLKEGMIDGPIIHLVNAFNQLGYCFTLQSCYGHFVYSGQADPYNLEPLPVTDKIDKIEYRIAM